MVASEIGSGVSVDNYPLRRGCTAQYRREMREAYRLARGIYAEKSPDRQRQCRLNDRRQSQLRHASNGSFAAATGFCLNARGKNISRR